MPFNIGANALLSFGRGLALPELLVKRHSAGSGRSPAGVIKCSSDVY
jgi:hypothetical protein